MRRVILAAALCLVLAPRAAWANDPQAALEAFLAAYWDDASGTFKKTQQGGTADFWWQAHFVELLLDGYQATHADRYKQILDRFVDSREQAGWKNSFNDDLGWWSLALARAYQVTGEERFKDRSIALFSSIAAFEDQGYGGGVRWKRDGSDDQKNVATNAPFVMTAAKLYEITGDPAYLAKAKSVYDWVNAKLVSGDHVADRVHGAGAGTVEDNGLTYNAGTWIGANVALYEATNDPVYLDRAKAFAARILRDGSQDGVLSEKGDDDLAGMKMILTRYLAQLAPYDPSILPALQANAAAAARNENAQGLTGSSWLERAGDGPIQSFAAASAADVPLQANAAQKAPPAPTTLGDDPLPLKPIPAARPLPGTQDQAASAATLHGLGLEGDHVAAWDKDAQWMDFHFTAAQEGDYTVVFHYAAGAGDATRYVYANGAGVKDQLAFEGTGAWSDARSQSIVVHLHAGDNVVSLIYDSSKKSANYLNVSGATLAPAPASDLVVASGAACPAGPSYTEGLLGALAR